MESQVTVTNEERAVGIGHIPSGLFIVCAPNGEKEGQWDGFLASWIQQVSFDPLLISLCVKEGRPSVQQILEGSPFSINVLGTDHKGILKHFWSGYDPNTNPFASIEHKTGETGELILAQSRSTLVCQKFSTDQPGDHHLVVAKVLKSIINDANSPSLVHTRKSGLSY